MKEISKEEEDYSKYPLPKFYKFKSKEALEKKLYQNFISVNQDIKEMVDSILKRHLK